MRIVEAISDTNIGGAGVLLLNRLAASPKESENTVVIIPKGSKLRERLERNHMKYREIEGCYDRSFQISAVFKYYRLIKSLSPNIINCHGCLSCRIAAWMCKVPVRIYTRHCSFPQKKLEKNRIYRAINGALQKKLSHHVIAVANAAKNDLIVSGVSKKDITVIINGVPPMRRCGIVERARLRGRMDIPQNAVIISIFARLEEYKDHKCLFDAARILLNYSDNFRFLVVGDGSKAQELHDYARSLKIDKYVIFIGFVDDVSPFFNITDININCSVGTETSSLALSEGMSLGIPSVASDFGGNTYMVENGVNGYIYPMGNHSSLAEKILLLSSNKELYEKMSENAFARYERDFDVKKMSRQTYALYRELLCRQQNIKYSAR